MRCLKGFQKGETLPRKRLVLPEISKTFVPFQAVLHSKACQSGVGESTSNTQWPCVLCSMHEQMLNASAAQGRCGYRVCHLHAGNHSRGSAQHWGGCIRAVQQGPSSASDCQVVSSENELGLWSSWSVRRRMDLTSSPHPATTASMTRAWRGRKSIPGDTAPA